GQFEERSLGLSLPVRPRRGLQVFPRGAVSREAGGEDREPPRSKPFTERAHGGRASGESVLQEHADRSSVEAERFAPRDDPGLRWVGHAQVRREWARNSWTIRNSANTPAAPTRAIRTAVNVHSRGPNASMMTACPPGVGRY